MYLLISLILGISLGVITSKAFDLSLLPVKLSRVALLVPFIGITEELIFRGFIQGHVRSSGRIFSMLFATTRHTLIYGIGYFKLVRSGAFQYSGTLIMDFYRRSAHQPFKEFSRSVIPSAIAHGCFHIILYGGFVIYGPVLGVGLTDSFQKLKLFRGSWSISISLKPAVNRHTW